MLGSNSSSTMARINRLFLLLSLLGAVVSCAEQPSDVCFVDALPTIYPDYCDVTIPADIAPLDFTLMDSQRPCTPADVEACHVVVRGDNGDSLVSCHATGARFDIEDWRCLTLSNTGRDLTVETYVKHEGRWLRYRDFAIHVSQHPLEAYGLTYRRFAPGYILSTDIGIYQRDLHSFDERAIVRNTEIRGHCLGCHTSCRGDASTFSLHVRGKAAATVLRRDGQDLWLETKTDSTLSKCVYPSWHPDGRHIAYSLNLTHQYFWLTGQHNTEVFDVASDMIVVDTETLRVLRSPLIEHTDAWMETFPAFSADGSLLYFCRSPRREIPEELDSLRYSLCSIAFDAATGTFGDTIKTLLDGEALGVSTTFPRPSYDGRWLVCTQAGTGYFTIHHDDADLCLLDLHSGTLRKLDEINSPHAESNCNWSPDSHWLVFGSRRDDGQYTRLYLTSIDKEGRASKPVLLPQRDPWRYYHESLQSYNTPDFIDAPVRFDAHKAFDHICDGERVPLIVEPRP